jgi:hypothetical protein
MITAFIRGSYFELPETNTGLHCFSWICPCKFNIIVANRQASKHITIKDQTRRKIKRIPKEKKTLSIWVFLITQSSQAHYEGCKTAHAILAE